MSGFQKNKMHKVSGDDRQLRVSLPKTLAHEAGLLPNMGVLFTITDGGLLLSPSPTVGTAAHERIEPREPLPSPSEPPAEKKWEQLPLPISNFILMRLVRRPIDALAYSDLLKKQYGVALSQDELLAMAESYKADMKEARVRTRQERAGYRHHIREPVQPARTWADLPALEKESILDKITDIVSAREQLRLLSELHGVRMSEETFFALANEHRKKKRIEEEKRKADIALPLSLGKFKIEPIYQKQPSFFLRR